MRSARRTSQMVGLELGVSCDRIGSSWMLREFVLGWSVLRGLEDRIECVGLTNSHPVLVQSEALPLYVDVKALLDDEAFCSINVHVEKLRLCWL